MTFEAAAASVVSALGEDVTYYSEEFGTVEVKGVRSTGQQRVDGPRGASVSSRNVELSILAAALPAEPRQGDQVTVRGVLYSVGLPIADEESTQYTLRLKKLG